MSYRIVEPFANPQLLFAGLLQISVGVAILFELAQRSSFGGEKKRQYADTLKFVCYNLIFVFVLLIAVQLKFIIIKVYD